MFLVEETLADCVAISSTADSYFPSSRNCTTQEPSIGILYTILHATDLSVVDRVLGRIRKEQVWNSLNLDCISSMPIC